MSQPTFTMPPVQPTGNQRLPRAMDDPIAAAPVQPMQATQPAQPMQPMQQSMQQPMQPIQPLQQQPMQTMPSMQPMQSTLPVQPMHEVPVPNMASQQTSSGSRAKHILANPDSLYKFISWEDPARTMTSYASVMAALFAVHYLPLTKTGLKIGATALGVAAAAEYGHRVFTPNTVMSRLRPKQYRTIPEPVLNDTLKDVHDLLQFLVVEAQRIVYAEKLDRTVAAFVGFTSLYWLVKILSPFALTLFTVTAIYATPLIMSPRGRQAMEEAKVQAVQLGNNAIETSQSLAADGRVKAAELSSKAQETAAGLTQSASQTASNVTAQTTDKASQLYNSAAQTASNITGQTSDKASQAYNSAAQTASNVTGQTSDKASQLYDSAAKTTSKSSSGPVSDLHDLATNTLGNNKIVDTNKVSSSKAPVTKTPTVPQTSVDSVGKTASGADFNNTNYSLNQDSKVLQNKGKSIPRKFDDMGLPATQKDAPGLARATVDQAGDSGIMGRPRGVPLADIDGAPVFGKFHEGAM
jgi:cell division septum initiation protein DivIVA